MPISHTLLHEARRATRELPPSVLDSLSLALEGAGGQGCDAALRARLLRLTTNPQFRQHVRRLIDAWQAAGAALTGAALAAALEAAAYVERAGREEMRAELVWTGPPTPEVALRRTEQALLQVIEEARRELVVVSFTVYKIPEIVMALTKALDRGVRMRIIAETPGASAGKVSYGAVAALGNAVMSRAEVFVWPAEKRPADERGRRGSLHVKCAAADGEVLFISSANLTGFALSINMEMGLLIHNQILAGQVTRHFEGLMAQGTLARRGVG
jgi:phosphatidylserine/phosphatidylglycerophosphate/cardiolipin synthase-like enzyme